MTRTSMAVTYPRIALVIEACLIAMIVIERLHKPPAAQPPAFPVAKRYFAQEPQKDALQQHVGELTFSAVPLHKVMAELASRSGENLGANWPELQASGIHPDVPIALFMSDPTLGSALDAICDQLETKFDVVAGYGQSPGGMIVLGPADYPRGFGVRAVPRSCCVLDLHDVLGGPVTWRPHPQVPVWLVQDDVEARLDLRDLADVLRNLIPGAEVRSFGTRIAVSGGPATCRMARILGEALRHPVPLRAQSPLPPESTEFDLKISRDLADEVLRNLQATCARGSIPLALKAENADADAGGRELTVKVSGPTFRTVEQNTGNRRVVFIAPGEEDRFAHIRRPVLEDGPRAYDVSALLAHASDWMAELGQAKPAPTAEEARIALIDLSTGSVNWGSDVIDGIAAWRGFLIVEQDPAVHRRLARFLERLQRTGRVRDLSADQ